MLQRLFDEGKIYKDKQVGFYSVRQEQFLTDKDRNEAGEFGPEWGEVEQREEENYYFKLSEHKEWLLQFLRSHPNFVSPSFRQTELINAVEKLSGDLCISRPKSRLSWGIELPFDRDYVNYVWFDALTNYISFIGYDPTRSTISDQSSTFRDKWPALHVIGKDIMIPAHGIYWPIMLHALGFPDDQMPTLLVHGWWNISRREDEQKFWATLSIPIVLIDKYGAEALRYYLMSVVTGNDADFSEGFLVTEYNHDLANTLGNLVNRTLNMIHRFRNGTIKSVGLSALAESEVRSHLQTWSDGELKTGHAFYRDKFADFRPSNALSAPLARALACNALVEISAPILRRANLSNVYNVRSSKYVGQSAESHIDSGQWRTRIHSGQIAISRPNCNACSRCSKAQRDGLWRRPDSSTILIRMILRRCVAVFRFAAPFSAIDSSKQQKPWE